MVSSTLGLKIIEEISPWYRSLKENGQLSEEGISANAFVREAMAAIVATGDCSPLCLYLINPIDYVFTDPPFGENLLLCRPELLWSSHGTVF